MYRAASITFTSNSSSFARCKPGKHHTLIAAIRYVEGVTSEAVATREVRSALITTLRGERARLVSWELVPLAS
jgi:hypothetical protein